MGGSGSGGDLKGVIGLAIGTNMQDRKKQIIKYDYCENYFKFLF